MVMMVDVMVVVSCGDVMVVLVMVVVIVMVMMVITIIVFLLLREVFLSSSVYTLYFIFTSLRGNVEQIKY